MEKLSFNWLLIFLGLGAVLLELFLGVDTGFDLVLLGIAFIVGGAAGNFFGNWQWGMMVAILLVIGYIVAGRKFIKNKLAIDTTATNIEQLIGKTAIVIREINPPQAGQVKIEGEIWRAQSHEKIEKDQKVKIISVDGVTVNVVKL